MGDLDLQIVNGSLVAGRFVFVKYLSPSQQFVFPITVHLTNGQTYWMRNYRISNGCVSSMGAWRFFVIAASDSSLTPFVARLSSQRCRRHPRCRRSSWRTGFRRRRPTLGFASLALHSSASSTLPGARRSTRASASIADSRSPSTIRCASRIRKLSRPRRPAPTLPRSRPSLTCSTASPRRPPSWQGCRRGRCTACTCGRRTSTCSTRPPPS